MTIGASTLKRPLRENVMDHAVSQDHLNEEMRKETRSHYQNRGRVLGGGANDWLTVWQAKNEL